MAYTLGIDLDIDQVKLCLIHVDGPHQTPYVDWLIFRVPFEFGPDYYCEFGTSLVETIAQFLMVKKLDPQQLNKIYFVCGMPFSAFASFEEGLHYTANVFIQSLFDPEKVGILRADGKPFAPRDIFNVKGENASAFVGTQFYGSAYLASRIHRNALIVDVGSGATHITPILKGRIDPSGRSKLGKYLRYRLAKEQYIQKGSLYTSVNQITQAVETKNQRFTVTPRVCRLAIIASLLGYVHPEIAQEHDFPLIPEKDAHILLARAVGLDTKSTTDKEIKDIAQTIYNQLCHQTGQSFSQILHAQGKRMVDKLELITTGLSGKQVMTQAFRKNQAIQERFHHLEDILPHRLHEASTAYGVALYAMERLMDESFQPHKVEVLP